MSKNRQRKEVSPINNYDLSPFMPQNSTNKFVQFEHDSIETLREKLRIKSEALNLLARQLEQCNKEKIEYKQMIDTLYDKNLSLKTALYYRENEVDVIDENFGSNINNNNSFSFNSAANKHRKLKSSKSFTPMNPPSITLFNDADSEDYMKVLKDLVKILQKEKHDLIQKFEESEQQLQDSKSDLRLLREQLVRQRIGSVHEGLSQLSKNHDDTQHFQTQASSNLRESLIKEIELLREQKTTLENDLKIFLCQKEELEMERDSFKNKYNKLNEFLIESSNSPNLTTNSIDYEESNVDQDKNNNKMIRKVQISLNIDELVSQNKYLTESNQNLKEELDLLKNSMKKLKGQATVSVSAKFLTVNKTDILEQQTNESKNIINKKTILNLLNKTDLFIQELESNNMNLNATNAIELLIELKGLIENLLENLNDKLTASQHQRKVNKMLATRIQDLEKQISLYFKPKSKKEEVSSSFHQNDLDINVLTTTPKIPGLNESISLIQFEDEKQ